MTDCITLQYNDSKITTSPDEHVDVPVKVFPYSDQRIFQCLAVDITQVSDDALRPPVNIFQDGFIRSRSSIQTLEKGNQVIEGHSFNYYKISELTVN